MLLNQLALALGLGLLVGLERERATKRFAGIRTFPLITVLGVLSGMIGQRSGAVVMAAVLVALAALTITSNVVLARQGPVKPGGTTEVAVLVMYAVGVTLSYNLLLEAVVVGAGTAVLLQWKLRLHQFVGRLSEGDMAALMRFALIALVILPLVPNRTFGPYQVLNPFEIWLMVVFIVGISMAGYIAFKLLGDRGGSFAAGLLGGLISSTATTFGYARRSGAGSPVPGAAGALVILLASTTVFGRVLFELMVVAPSVLLAVAGPLLAMLAFLAGVSTLLYHRRVRQLPSVPAETEPPSDLRAAVLFGVLYGAVLLGVAFARDSFGTAGMYLVAGFSGLTDMDAITLSTARMMKSQALTAATGWRLIMVGALANLVFKGTVVALVARGELRRRVLQMFAAAVAAGLALLLLWP